LDDVKQARGMGSQGDSDAALRHLASTVVLVAALVLIVIKIWGWVVTGSMVLLTSAADGVVDLLAATATFFGVRFAERPADAGHRFGHGKGEALAAFTQAILLAGTASVLAAQSCWRLIYSQLLTAVTLGLWVAAGGIAISSLLVGMQTWVVRRTGSIAIAADRKHYLADVFLNGAVLVALALEYVTGWERVDPVFALVITGYMINSARQVAVTASHQLLDHELPEDQRERIKAAAASCSGARGLSNLRTRDAGDRAFVEFHLEVDGQLSVQQGHEIVDAAERAIAALFPKETEVIGHVEPVRTV
jgi:cation diffusion facilitator family transporter